MLHCQCCFTYSGHGMESYFNFSVMVYKLKQLQYCANKRCDIKLRKGRQSTDVQPVDFSVHFLWLDKLILFYMF